MTRNLPSPTKRTRIVTDDELILLHDTLIAWMPEVWRMIVAALHTGLRETKLLFVEEHWLCVEEDGYWLVLPPARSSLKGNPLKIPLNRPALTALFPPDQSLPDKRIFHRWSPGTPLRRPGIES